MTPLHDRLGGEPATQAARISSTGGLWRRPRLELLDDVDMTGQMARAEGLPHHGYRRTRQVHGERTRGKNTGKDMTDGHPTATRTWLHGDSMTAT